MSWLVGGSPSRGDVLGLRPELAERHAALLDAIWAGPVSPVTLELCRLRMAVLLQSSAAQAERSVAATAAGLDEAKVAALPRWSTDPSFSEEERACLDLTELLVIDQHAITDEQVARVERALGPPGVVHLFTALGTWDAQHRFDTALGVARA